MNEGELVYLFKSMPADIARSESVKTLANYIFKSHGKCCKCGLPWGACNSKSVPISKSMGVFATCDVCWNNSSLNELYGYYEAKYKIQSESASDSNGKLSFTLEHLLQCVCKEFYASTNS